MVLLVHPLIQTTLVWVTVLFSVICGNRLMDNRLLRSSSHAGPFKTIHRDDFLEAIPNFKEDFESPSNGKLIMDMPVPCTAQMNYNQHQQGERNCKENWMDFIKPETNYVNYEDLDGDDDADDTDRPAADNFPIFNDHTFYGNTKNHDGVFKAEDSRHSKILTPLISALPVANYNEFYADLVLDSQKEMSQKRNGNYIGPPMGTQPARGCDCKVKNDLVDLGQQHFPRYLLNAVCQTEQSRANDLAPKCWSGSICRPLEYKVKVLTFRSLMDNMQKDLTLAWLPDDLRQIWKFKTVTVTAGCFCS